MSSETDRAKSGLSKFIRKLLNAFIVISIDHLASYQCKVISQNSDGTLELQPDDNRLPTYSKVPIRYGIPGVTVQVVSGSRVLLEFAGANPQRAIATVWESASVTQLTVTANGIILNSGSNGVARNGDSVKVTIPTNALTLVVSGASATGPVAPLDVTGTITAASTTVKAG